MDIKNADDVQLLVEDFGWTNLEPAHAADKLRRMNDEQIAAQRLQVNRRVWDETYDEEMAMKARWHYTRQHAVFAEAIMLWLEGKSK